MHRTFLIMLNLTFFCSKQDIFYKFLKTQDNTMKYYLSQYYKEPKKIITKSRISHHQLEDTMPTKLSRDQR